MEKVEIVETVRKEKKVISVICNMCGKTDEGFQNIMFSDISKINIEFGFGSTFDGETWDLDLCDSCLEKIASKLKYPPEKKCFECPVEGENNEIE